MNRFCMILIFILLSLVRIAPESRAEEPAKGEMSEEELIFMEVPIVVTASRKAQPITEAPAAVTVVSAEEIRQSGAMTVPDVLRMVSGVDVMTITARDQQVGIRGVNGPINNKLLVLIDGRTVYIDFAGDVPWNLFPVSLEEIERIEVIKSPISTLYGANAFSGVVNIITRTPREIDGTQVSVTVGSRETYIGTLIHGGEWKKLHYKLSLGFDRADEWGSDKRSADIFRGNFSLGYDIGPEQTVALSGGRAHFEDYRLFYNEKVGALMQKGDHDYLQLDYRYKRFKVRAFRKSEDPEQVLVRTGRPDKWDVALYDAEVQYAFNAGGSHSFMVGADYRDLILKKNNIIPADHSQNLYALFLEDEFRVSDRIRLVAGGRYDHHPLVRGHFSPRGTILYSPVEGHNIRLSAAQAYRNPSLLESYLSVVSPGVPFSFASEGNTDLKSEGVISYEIGYRAALEQRATLGLNLFYNEYSDLIIASTTVAPPQIISSFINGGNARGVGGELDLDLLVTDGLSLFTNYSYQRITDKDDNPFTLTINEKARVRGDTPEHKVNAGIRMKFRNGLSVNLLTHWVDKTERLISDLAGNEFLAKVRSYTTVDGRVGYTFWKGNAEASLSAFNIFNDGHYEYPSGINLPDRSSEPIGRKLAFKVSCRF